MFTLLQVQNPVLRPGTGTFASHTLEIFLICLGMFLLGWFLHHLIHCSRHKSRIAELEANLKSARTRIGDLEGDLDSCNAAMINVKGENAALSTKLSRLVDETSINQTSKKAVSKSVETPAISEEAVVSSLATDIVGSGGTGFDADGAKAVFGRKIKEDDLKIVEGIGPKTEELLHSSSIHTWRQLGNTSVPQLQSILNKAGDRFQLLNPGTWPKQSRMASEGQWIKLREYQDYLVGGVEPEGDIPAPIDDAGVQYIMGKRIKQDDLTVVEGIGPKIQSLLHENGIDTWYKLSQTDVSRLKEILNAAGDRYRIHEPGTWPKQSGLAHEAKWDQLKEYQDFLDGGKEPST